MARQRAVYPTLEAYYAADERRLRSEECDYGVHWRLKGWEHRWRVSYVRNTGEIYAVNQGSSIGPVFVMAIIPSDPVADGDRRSLFYATLEEVLEGWAEQCGRVDSLRWVRDRLDNVDMTPLIDRSVAVPAGMYAAGRCLGCGCWIEAATEDEWRLRVRAPCPSCGRQVW